MNFKNYFENLYKNILNNKVKFFSALLLIVIVILLFCFSLPPKNFKQKIIFDVEQGQTIKEISIKLKESNIIKSDKLFSFLIKISRNHVVAGRYLFEPKTVFSIVRQVATGDFGAPAYQITFFEGITTKEMAKILKENIKDFDENKFIELTKDKEGYLFPDTYRIYEINSPEQIIKMLEDNFDKKINEIEPLIKKSKYSLSDIIIMASIIEKEADATSKQEVSNILWKRYENDLPLQVDAPFVYSIGKGTFDLTREDLRSDDPFNTYNKIGLVPSPISNPGIESIKAAANPQETEYFYFLTGRDGKMYYAKTFEEHKKNRLLYLD